MGAPLWKPTTDAFRPTWACQNLELIRLTLAVTDETGCAIPTAPPGAWFITALRDAGVEALVTEIKDELRAAALAA